MRRGVFVRSAAELGHYDCQFGDKIRDALLEVLMYAAHDI